jgi:hypothetical protein
MAAPLSTTYDRETTVKLICAKMMLGRSLRQICREEEMPSLTTVIRWLDEDESGELRAQYARAREALADAWFDEMRDVAFDDADDPNNKRVKLDMLKWTVSKLAPKRYGDKVEHQHGGTGPGGAILIATGVVRAED